MQDQDDFKVGRSKKPNDTRSKNKIQIIAIAVVVCLVLLWISSNRSGDSSSDSASRGSEPKTRSWFSRAAPAKPAGHWLNRATGLTNKQLCGGAALTTAGGVYCASQLNPDGYVPEKLKEKLGLGRKTNKFAGVYATLAFVGTAVATVFGVAHWQEKTVGELLAGWWQAALGSSEADIHNPADTGTTANGSKNGRRPNPAPQNTGTTANGPKNGRRPNPAPQNTGTTANGPKNGRRPNLEPQNTGATANGPKNGRRPNLEPQNTGRTSNGPKNGRQPDQRKPANNGRQPHQTKPAPQIENQNQASRPPNPTNRNRWEDGTFSSPDFEWPSEVRLWDDTGLPKMSDVMLKWKDCFLIASMATLAQQNPKFITRMVREKDGRIQVDLYVTGKRETIEVDHRLPKKTLEYYKMWEFHNYWFAYIEKAFAKYYGGYDALTGGRVQDALTCLTGQPTGAPLEVRTLTPESLKRYIDDKYLVVGSGGRTSCIGPHAFAVSSVDGGYVYIFDPNNHDYNKTPMALKTTTATPNKGIVKLTWSDFVLEFSSQGLRGGGGVDLCKIGLYEPRYTLRSSKGQYQINYMTPSGNTPTKVDDHMQEIVVSGFTSKGYCARTTLYYMCQIPSAVEAFRMIGSSTKSEIQKRGFKNSPRYFVLQANQRYHLRLEGQMDGPNQKPTLAEATTVIYVRKGSAISLRLEDEHKTVIPPQ